MKMAYFVLALTGMLGALGITAMVTAFVYALYIKYWLGDRRKLLDIFWSL
jgi:hypothetical protein